MSARQYLAIVLAVAFLTIAKRSDAETWSLSLKSVPVQAHERVIGYRAKITSGTVTSLINIPVGWDVVLHNDENWSAEVSASIRVGAAAFDSEGAKRFFRNFMVVKKLTIPSKFQAASFEVHIEIGITTDFENQKWVSIPPQALRIEKIK